MAVIPRESDSREAQAADFESAGFASVQIRRQEQDLVMDGGVAQAVKVAYSSPIGPTLRALPDEKREQFRQTLTEILEDLSEDGATMGRMASKALTAEKQM